MNELLELQKKVFTLFTQTNYDEALQTIAEIEEKHPEMKDKTSFWKACLYSMTGRPDAAVQTLRTALKEGYWWNPDQLLKDEDLKPLRELDSFKEIVEESRNRFEVTKRTGSPDLLLYPSDKHQVPMPLLYVLHWRGDSAERFSWYWAPESLGDRIHVAFPQSSQVYGYQAYCWDDGKLARNEIYEQFSVVVSRVAVDEEQVILAGASQGGKLALELALEGTPIQAKGFIVVVPSIRDVAGYQSLIEKAKGNFIRGWIITGDQDHYYESTVALHRDLERAGIACKLVVVKGLGHFFPENFADLLQEALDDLLRMK